MATYAAYRHVELDNVGYGKKRVLKPPGGGSSDIFGAPPEETSPRRIKAHNQSQLGSALFGDVNGTDGPNNANIAVSPRCANKPGNDSYKRLFGPPDVPHSTPNARNHMRSNISLSGGSSASSLSSGVATSPAKSTISSRNSTSSIANGFASNGKNLTNDITGGTACMPARNPVTGDGIEVTPVRRSVRKYRDGNPVTGTGYTSEPQKNGPTMQNGTVSSNSSSGEKSSDSSPVAKAPTRTRVPPGGYSSGLW